MGRSTRHRDELIVALRDGGEAFEDISRVLNISHSRVRAVYFEATRVGFPAEFAERFWSQVRMCDGCWEWQGYRDPTSGYGVTIFRAPLRAYRVAWELIFGPIPRGLHVCHACDNPPCCRPDHLWLGTNADNQADKVAKGRHRPYAGHEARPRLQGAARAGCSSPARRATAT